MTIIPWLKVSVCICTRNRPALLRECLQSIYSSSLKPFEIIVSDDSTNSETRNLIESEFSDITYISGPRQGLAANRNCVMQKVRGERFVFTDDDCLLDELFIENCLVAAAAQPEPEMTIISGLRYENGKPLGKPNGPSYLGHFMKPIEGDQLETIVIDACMLPSGVVNDLKFDESIKGYGYEEMDFALHARAKGYRIVFAENAKVEHRPGPNEDRTRPSDANRIYVAWKWRQGRLNRSFFLVVALSHLFGSCLRKH